MKLTQTITERTSLNRSRTIRNVIHGLTNGMNKNDILIITFGPDGNYQHGLQRANIGETFEKGLARISVRTEK